MKVQNGIKTVKRCKIRICWQLGKGIGHIFKNSRNKIVTFNKISKILRQEEIKISKINNSDSQ